MELCIEKKEELCQGQSRESKYLDVICREKQGVYL